MGLGRRPAARAHPHRLSRDAAQDAAQDVDSPRRLHRPAPVGPRGPGGGPQAPRHVHRVDRQPGTAALPGRDPRQRRGRGAGRALHRDRGDAARGRLGRGAGQRPRHPGRCRAQDQADRRGAGDDQAARGRQVRWRLVHRLRRPARRRRLGCQRAGLAAGRRGGPGGAHLGGELPPRRHRRVRRAGPGRRLQQEGGAAPAQPRHQEGHRDQDQVLAGPAGVHLRRQVQLRRAHRAGQADRLPGARADHQHPRGAARGHAQRRPRRAGAGQAGGVPLRRRHQRVLRPPRLGRGGHRRAAAHRLRQLHRDDPGARRPGAHDPDRGRAGDAGRRGAPVGQRLRRRGPLVRERHRHPARRHARRRVRAGHGQHAERPAHRKSGW